MDLLVKGFGFRDICGSRSESAGFGKGCHHSCAETVDWVLEYHT